MVRFIFTTPNLATVTKVLWIRLIVTNALAQKPVEDMNSTRVSTIHMNINHSLIPDIFESACDKCTEFTKNDTDSHLLQTVKMPIEIQSLRNEIFTEWMLRSLASTQMEGSKQKASLLHLLAKANAVDAVEALLMAGANVNTSDHEGETPLHWAVRGGAHDVIKFLIDAGADPKVYARFGTTPLLLSVSLDDVEAFRILIGSLPNMTASGHLANSVFATSITWRSYNVLKTFIQDVGVISRPSLQYAWDTVLHAGDSKAMRLLIAAKVDEGDSSIKTSLVYRLNELTRPGQEDILKSLVTAGADVNERNNWSGHTPLMNAAAHNNPTSIKILVEAGARLEDVDRDEKTALLHAAEHGSVEALTTLLSLGAYVNATSNTGDVALHHALKHSDAATAVLLDAGIDRESKNNAGMTPVFMSAGQSPEALRRLIKTNVSLNIRDNFNRTPLMYHILLGDTIGTNELLEYAPEVDVRDNDGDTALLLAAKQEKGNRWSPAFEESDLLPILKKLINLGADLDAQDSRGKSALHWFAGKDFALTLEYLLKLGADKDIRDARGYAPIHCAAESGKLNALRKLLAVSVDVDSRDRRGRTALIVAVENDQSCIVPALVSAGAHIDAHDDSGRTALHVAVKPAAKSQDDMEVYKPLLQKGVNTYTISSMDEIPLHCSVDHPYVLKELLKSGSDKNAQDENGTTPLHLAVQNDWRLSIATLLESEVNVNMQDKKGKTPAMYAAENNNVNALKKLIKAGADVGARDEEGRTALHQATVNGSVSALKYLLEIRVTVDAKDNNGKTPLHLASERNNLKALEALLAAGAGVNLPDGAGRSALHWAALRGGERIVKRLIQAGADVDAEDEEGRTSLWDAVLSNEAPSAALLVGAGADASHEVQGRTPLDLTKGRTDASAWKNILQNTKTTRIDPVTADVK